jgi:hypothetical protein
MNGFKFYKKINDANINIKFVYDEYINFGNNNYAPSRLRAIISGLAKTYIEINERVGHKDFEIGREELATKLNITSVDADKLLKADEKEFLESENFLTSNNEAIIDLLKKVDDFLKEYKNHD